MPCGSIAYAYWRLDTIARSRGTRVVLRFIDQFLVGLWTAGIRSTIRYRRTYVGCRLDYLHETIDCKFNRSTSTNCCVANGILPNTGYNIIGMSHSLMLEARLTFIGICGTIFLFLDRPGGQCQTFYDGNCRVEPVRVDERCASTFPALKHHDYIIRAQDREQEMGSRKAGDSNLWSERISNAGSTG